MNVKLISKSVGVGEFEGKGIEDIIVYAARVSSSRKDKFDKPEGLIRYCINNAHWSIFEQGFVTFEINTSKAIGIQLLRHRSFSFQEFSQRYQDVNRLDDVFEPVQLRKQAENNRQSSTEEFNPELELYDYMFGITPGEYYSSDIIDGLKENILYLYQELLKQGVAREQARMILPMCTSTKIYMSGSIRSWLHFIQVRDDEHAQLEIQLIAKEIRRQLGEVIPITMKAFNNEDRN